MTEPDGQREILGNDTENCSGNHICSAMPLLIWLDFGNLDWTLHVLQFDLSRSALCFRRRLQVFSGHYNERAALWESVRFELRAFRGLMVLAESNWDWQWSPQVYQVDASLSGFGIVSSIWPLRKYKMLGEQMKGPGGSLELSRVAMRL